jgi:hypothetical protein
MFHCGGYCMHVFSADGKQAKVELIAPAYPAAGEFELVEQGFD